jgi:hypothetical protein
MPYLTAPLTKDFLITVLFQTMPAKADRPGRIIYQNTAFMRKTLLPTVEIPVSSSQPCFNGNNEMSCFPIGNLHVINLVYNCSVII